MTVDCSSGTYVRALARDLGAGLGVGGHLTALRRTRVGPYDLAGARTLDQLEEQVPLYRSPGRGRSLPRGSTCRPSRCVRCCTAYNCR